MSATEWPIESDEFSPSTVQADPTMPSDLLGVIGYCSEKTMGELPGSLVSPSTIHKSLQDAKHYLFGTDLENSMRASLDQYTEVRFLYSFMMVCYDILILFFIEPMKNFF